MEDLGSSATWPANGRIGAPESSLRVVLHAVPARAGLPPGAERRAAPRRAIGHLGIVVQIHARRRLRRMWRPGVSAAVAIIDVALPPGRPIRLTGRDLRTGCIVIMDADEARDRVTVIGIRPPTGARMRPVGRRFRALEPGILPSMLQRLSVFTAPLPGHGPWELPKRVPMGQRTQEVPDSAPPLQWAEPAAQAHPTPGRVRSRDALVPVQAAVASRPSTYLGLVAGGPEVARRRHHVQLVV